VTIDTAPARPTSTSEPGSDALIGIVVGCVLGAGVLALLALVVFLVLRKKRSKKEDQSQPEQLSMGQEMASAHGSSGIYTSINNVSQSDVCKFLKVVFFCFRLKF